MTDWRELESRYMMHTVERVPVTLVRGAGAYVWDDQGRQYLDFVGGWAVDSLGHCHPAVVEAITQQANILLQVSNQFYSIPQLKLAQLLVDNSCCSKVFLCNSGAEANEGAVKLARRYGKLKLNGAFEVISTFNSFHGRTLAMVAATGQAKFQKPYEPLPVGFINVEFNSVPAIMAATTGKTCAVLLEAVQGEGGVNVPSEDYLRKVRDWCDKKGILLILDEVQTGLGRLGSLFAYQRYGIEPDIITLAKGLGGGVPIGAILAKENAAVFTPGDHGSTFGGNPLACAAAYAVLDYIIKNDICGQVTRTGAYFMEGLRDLKKRYKFIVDIRGQGLLLAMQFDKEIGQSVLKGCLERGLLVNSVKPNALRFMPPLIISEKDADEALAILDKALADQL